MKTNKKKILIRTLCIALAVLIAVPISYLLYVVISYDRIEDMQKLKISGNATDAVPVNQTLSLVTYNIGFGAYSDDYSFFMDGGEYSRAFSEKAVLKNTKGALDAVNSVNPDFVFFQEVDIDGDRSYHVDQSAIISKGMTGYDRVFAQNYDSAYLFYPFNEPIGANKSGMMTMSRYNITSSVRRSLPIESSLYKFLDLDRAYSVSEVPTANGKKLVMYNVHLSAYTSDGTIANEQLKMLASDMKKQYEKGNYVIAAGDFNKDLLIDSSKYFERKGDEDFTWAKPIDTSLLPTGFTVHTGSNLPTCRNADSAYRGDGTDFVLSVDGVIISPNVKTVSVNTLDVGFKYSDHNPVKMEFVLM